RGDVRVRDKVNGRYRAVVGLLDLGGLVLRGTEVGRSGGHHDHVGVVRGSQRRLAQLLGGTDADDLDTGRVGQGRVCRDQGDRGAAYDGGAREGVPRLARRPVAEEPDRVQRLAGTPGGDDHVRTSQVARWWAATAQYRPSQFEDLRWLRQPALAGVLAGQPAHGRLHDDGVPPAQRRDVGLGGRVLPHLGVHRRRVDDRAPRGEQRIGQQVVGQAVRGPGEQVGGGRRDHHEVGVAAQLDVRYLVDVGPDLVGNRLAGQGRPGGRADEAQRGGGRHDAYPVPGLG